jgi:glycosyltransferase involved in cell wall biosynthesis
MTGPVVLLSTSLSRGGAETQVALLAVELRRRGWAVHVVSLVEPDAFLPELAAAGVPVHSLGMTPGKPDLRGAARLAALLRRIRPAVVHSHLFHANLMARLARLAFPLPRVISTLHSLAESSRESADVRWRDRLYRLTNPLSDCTVAVCQAVGERHVAAKAVDRRKLRVVPNGVDTNTFRPDAPRRARLRADLGAGDRFVWLAAGRLMWKKDYPTLLRAAARLPACELWIAGNGPQDQDLRSLAGELRVPARFLGPREDIPALMNAADALVLSSQVEGLPMVLLEAAASGLPVVSTKAGGSAEVVADGRTGFLAPCGDPESLAASMSRLLELPPTAGEQMGRAARALALERYDLPVVATLWEQLYREGPAWT